MRILIGFAVGLLLLVLAAATGLAWWLTRPGLLEEYVLEPLHERTGVTVQVGRTGIGWRGIALDEVSVFAPAQDPKSDAPPAIRVARVSVRPNWEPLLDRRVVISGVWVDGLEMAMHREPDGTAAVQSIIDALSTLMDDDAGETAEPSPAVDSGAATEAPTLELHLVQVRNATLSYLDEFERPTSPLRVRMNLEALDVRLPAGDDMAFELDGDILLGTETRSKVDASGTIQSSPLTIQTKIDLSEVNVDTLVPAVENPDDPEVPGPLPLDDIRIEGTVHADRVQYEGFVFRNADAVATLDGPKLSVPSVRAAIAGGTADVSAEIDFGLQGFHYTGQVSLDEVHLGQAGGLLNPIEWGRHPDPIATIQAKLSMAGTRVPRLLDTIDLDARISVDALDLDAILGRDRPGAPTDLGPYDTGSGTMLVRANIEEAVSAPYVYTSVQLEARLSDSHLDVKDGQGELAGGLLHVVGDVDLTQPGLTYRAKISLDQAQIETLSAPLARKEWGTRSGVLSFETQLYGHGTNIDTFPGHLSGQGKVDWTHGRVAHSEILEELSDTTGIPGFRDLVIQDSGGSFRILNGTLSTERLRVWGPDAGIQAAGSIDWKGRIDAKVSLGIGPHSNRELFSTGIALPYIHGEDGWRFVPLDVAGTIEDPTVTIPKKAVLQSALTTVPSAGVGVVSSGLDVVRGGTRAVVRGTRSLLPGAEPEAEAAEADVNAGTGVVRGFLREGVGAFGKAVGGLFGDDDTTFEKGDRP